MADKTPRSFLSPPDNFLSDQKSWDAAHKDALGLHGSSTRVRAVGARVEQVSAELSLAQRRRAQSSWELG